MRSATAIIALLICRLAAPAAEIPDASLLRLQKQIQLLAKTTDGTVGVSALHLESSRAVSVRGREQFPMASIVKVPIAVQLMKLVDEGKLSLDKMITLSPSDLHPGSGNLTELLFHPGLSISLENLMEIMLVISDNSAADLCLREAGGPAAVTARMKEMGLKIRVDRNIALLIADWVGVNVKQLPPESEWNKDMWERLENAVPDKEHLQARRASIADPRDTSSPDDMTQLIAHIWKKDTLEPASANVLIGVLQRCITGKARIKGMLPAGTEVAHKTGTLGGVVDDAGVITLPNGAGHLVVSVFTKGFGKPSETAEKAVAEISRTLYDYFSLVQ